MKKALIGAGGHSREIKAHLGIQNIKCFVDDNYWTPNENNIFPLSTFDPNKFIVMVAIGEPALREKIVNKLPKNTKFFTYIHPSSNLFYNINVEEGTFIGANCNLTCDIEIGKHSILNRSVNIGHDCKLGNYFSAMTGVTVSGNVTVGNNVYIGNNASIREKLNITDSVTIGSNATIVKNIITHGTYVGVPAKKLKK